MEGVEAIKTTPRKRKKRLYSGVSPNQNLNLIHKVSAAKDHIAIYGNVSKRFEEAAAYICVNILMTQSLTRKCIQDRKKRFKAHLIDRTGGNNFVLEFVERWGRWVWC